MGCDIHSVAQVREDKKWKTVEVRVIGDPRNYDYFAMLAGVRNGSGFAGIRTGAGFKPIAKPRGLPDDFKVTKDEQHQGHWMGDHSHSWLTLDELLKYDLSQETLKQGIVTWAEYLAWHKNGRGWPESWCGGVGGPGVIVLPLTEADKLREKKLNPDAGGNTYVQLTWGTKYGEVRPITNLIERLKEIADKFYVEPEDVRFVFGFDS